MNPDRILIVEDEAIVAMDIEERLAGMGYELAGRANSGEQALALAEELRPSLVLMDIHLQGSMDGIAVAEAMRRRYHVPVILPDGLFRGRHAQPRQTGRTVRPTSSSPSTTGNSNPPSRSRSNKHGADEEIRRMNRLYNVLSQVNPNHCARPVTR